MRFRTAQMESWSARFASSTIWNYDEKTILRPIRAGSHHFVASANENSDSLRVCALLNDKHLVSCCSKGELTDKTSSTELGRGQILEARDNSPIGGDGDQLYSECQPRAGIRTVENTSISGPPTHRTAGSSFCISIWLASSSKPHWQMTRLAPVSLTRLIMSVNFSFS